MEQPEKLLSVAKVFPLGGSSLCRIITGYYLQDLRGETFIGSPTVEERWRMKMEVTGAVC